MHKSGSTIGCQEQQKEIRHLLVLKTYTELGEYNINNIKGLYQKLSFLPTLRFAEWAVLGHFILLILLWLTRDPKFVSGWSIIFPPG